MSELPYITWILEEDDQVVVRGNTVYAQCQLQVLPNIVIPGGTDGILIGSPDSNLFVMWNVPNSGWHFIQVVMNLLQTQVSFVTLQFCQFFKCKKMR